MLSRLHVIPVDGGLPVGPGFGEANLDVEDLSAMAPGATIDVNEGPSPGADGVVYDPVDEYAAIIDADRDQVISTSWGLCEQAIQAGQPGLQQVENLLFEQAVAQGSPCSQRPGTTARTTATRSKPRALRRGRTHCPSMTLSNSSRLGAASAS
jgi:subtilase family serine protease